MAMIFRYKKFVLLEVEAAKNPLLIFLSGFGALIIGIMLVVSHNIWVWDWRLVITLIGWMTLIKGIIRIFYPEAVLKLIEKKITKCWFFLAEIAFFFVGLCLIYHGFFV
jgi:hypothetical protein